MKITRIDIEKIEAYYLDTITKYIGADINGLIRKLENHNKTWDDWIKKASKRKSFFDTGAERVIYMLLNRGDILGEPNANPVGSDSSFLKFDESFGEYLAINIDVKSLKANTNIGDIISNIPVGINQNSYACLIEYKNGPGKSIVYERKKYNPGLKKFYTIEDQHGISRDYLTLSFEIVILYEQLPIGQTATSEKVIGVFTTCIPNGMLRRNYRNNVFDPGKTSGLVLIKNQKIILPGGGSVRSKGGETWDTINTLGLTKEEYILYNGLRDIEWKVDARYNYMRNGKFKLLPNRPSRINKLFLDYDKMDYQYKWVDENVIRPTEKKPHQSTKDALKFLKDLPTS